MRILLVNQCMLSCVVLISSLASASAASADPAWPAGLGQHRALIHLDSGALERAAASGTDGAAWVDIPWQRRQVPDPDRTNVVITVASSGAVVSNALRAPVPGAANSREALGFVFEPVAAAPASNWIANNGTAAASIVTGCSGAQRPTLDCWKAVDGLLLFNDASPRSDQGWDGKAEANGTEWIEFDLGGAAAAVAGGEGQPGLLPIDRVGLYSVARADDPKWFPQHNPAEVKLFARADAGADTPWQLLVSKTLAPSDFDADGLSLLSGWGAGASASASAAPAALRFWRLEILSRLVTTIPQAGSHSYVKEVRFGRAPAAPTPAPQYETAYHAYSMPFTRHGSKTGLSLNDVYDAPVVTANATWRAACGLTDAALASGAYRATFPQGKAQRIGRNGSFDEAASAFDAFDVMERPATAASVAAMLARL
eukprot:g4808.t1